MNVLERDAIRLVAMSVRQGARAATEVREAVTLGIYAISDDADACHHAIDNAMALYGMIVAVVESSP